MGGGGSIVSEKPLLMCVLNARKVEGLLKWVKETLTLGLVLLIAMALLIPAAANAAVRPVIRGTDFSVSACKPEAAMAGYEILKKGGNAYDAAVAAQAVLALTDPAMNGVGSDAMILVYDSKAKKVKAINAAGWSPKLATIDWYNKNNDGVIPANDGLLSATVPAVVDAWCTMLTSEEL